MNVWMLVDDRGCVLALNHNDMTGNSGWSETTVEALGLSVDSDLHDAHGAALYKYAGGHVVARTPEEIAADAPAEEPKEITESERLDQIEAALIEVAGLAALALGGE